MNQMLKKASSVCAAAVCAASLMFSGASVVMADSEIDEATMTQITMTAEGLTQTIIPLSDEEIEAYLKTDDEFTLSAMTAWDSAKEEVGELKEAGKAEVEFSNHQYTATVPVDFEKLDADFVYVFEEIEGMLTPVSASVDVQYPLSTIMKNAGLNTLMGIGTVFVILVLLIFIISLFKFIPGSPAAAKKEKKEESPAPVAVPVQETVQAADDTELIAVIAAAIAAAEGTTTDGFVVRSIRKINRPRR
ncbi:OadG family protein [Blautia sp. XA-2221]|uniref:OadG family protein n=1 Tax=Blautia sp. XA-2221 TaxID=2903961 RepID=UPI0023799E98|nr:OadG family protein [Blautia sp. XA-2221]